MSKEDAPRADSLLERLPLLAGLSAPARQAVLAHAQRRLVDRGAALYREGDPALAFHYLATGKIKRVVCSAEGAEKVIDLVLPGETIGLSEVFAASGFACRAEALEPSTVVEIGLPALEQAMARDPRLSRRIITVIANRNTGLVRDIAASHFHSACRRVLDYLRHLAESAAPAEPGGPASFVLPVRKHLLAAQLGLSPETLSRVFRDLSEVGLISVAGPRITLARDLDLHASVIGESRRRVLAGARSAGHAGR
ncbi:MAG: Crp/Fnr family transcriptional regulator [Rhodocyclaceae bacterium]|nr:Crp/Fnr family transcriptional regulator [Rhodocyclaceae bacterium]